MELSQNLNNTPHAASWTDGKRYLWLLSPALPLIGLAGVLLSPLSAAWLFVLPVLYYGVWPILDWLVGEDTHNAPESAVKPLEDDRYYRWIVAAYMPSQFAAVIVGTYLAATAGWPAWEWIGGIFTVGIISGVGINTAHELGHKTNTWERWLAKIALVPVCYGHFFVEHNKGHHKNVATHIDPASSRMGESFWAFLPRTMIGSLRSAWHIESARLKRLDKPVWSIHNEVLQPFAMTFVLYAALTVWLGPIALLFLFLQAFYGAALLEVVNYLEHYGLVRKRLPNGRYERCQPRHSWNSNHIVSNLVLYQLQRHSDHHANPTRRFQALRHFEESPQLPSGYMGMIPVAYFPPLWFALMDKRVVAHHNGDLRWAHLQPSKREKLLKRWPVPADASDASETTADTAAAASNDDAARHQCPNCSYVYDEAIGVPHEGYPAGTKWVDLPADWQCPQCAVREKPDFAAAA